MLEVVVKPDPKHLYRAPDKNGNWKPFFRVKDENIVATPLQVKVWKALRYKKAIRVRLTGKDELLMKYLQAVSYTHLDVYKRQAFANTDGGTLLIGVKDNGNVSGVNSDEEYYMLEGAARHYCKPEVKFIVTRWEILSLIHI